jgi:SAM-dependent methyltransferase
VKTGAAGEDVGHEAGSLTIPKVAVEAHEGLAASNARRLFSEKHATYARFIAFVHYPQGLRAFFRRSSLLRSGIRVLDAGCGTGAATLAIHDALVQRAATPGRLDAFDLTPAMLDRFRKTLETLGITLVEARQANVLEMDTLPTAWTNYDLIVTASMLEYLPRERLSEAPPPLVPSLKAGDVAAAFALQGSDGKVHRLSDYKGKTVIIAWFPKAFTGG